MDRQSFESLIESGAFGPSGPFVPQNHEWEIPIPFTEINTPPFPVEALPGPLAAFVESLSESTQTPEEMAWQPHFNQSSLLKLHRTGKNRYVFTVWPWPLQGNENPPLSLP